MKYSAGTLWEARLDEEFIWLLDWTPPALAKRRVLLAIDSTDSCGEYVSATGTWRLHHHIKELLQTLAQILEPEDTCALWMMGHNTPVLRQSFSRQHQNYPGEFAATLERAIQPVRGGTWLVDTLKSMLREAAHHQAAGMQPFLLLVTDGEVFDADGIREILRDEHIGLVQLGPWVGPQWLKQHTEEVQLKRDRLEQFLTLPARKISWTAPMWSGTDVRRFSKEGELLTDDPGQLSPNEAYVGVVFVGRNQPFPKLVFAVENTSSEVIAVEKKPLSNSAPAHLQRVLDLLRQRSLHWDHARLRDLVAALRAAQTPEKATSVFTCRSERCSSRFLTTDDLQRSLFCRWCNALLLALETKKRDQLLEHKIPCQWLCHIEADGSVGHPMPSNLESNGKACWLFTKDNGTWLGLDLDTPIYF